MMTANNNAGHDSEPATITSGYFDNPIYIHIWIDRYSSKTLPTFQAN